MSSYPDSDEYTALFDGGFADYRLRINGLVEDPVELDLTQLRAVPNHEQITQHFCIQSWSGVAKWGGVSMQTTKTGSTLARRLLVESAWHYHRTPNIGAPLHRRQDGQPDHILAISNRAQQRLHRVHRKMRARGKAPNVTVVAMARELTCFLWAAATAD